MTYKRAEFYYLSSNAWVQALTHSGNSALVDVRLLDTMGNSRKLGVTLSNIPKDFTSSNTTDQTGLLSNVFQDYQHVLLRDGETHQILFKGRIYNISKDYNPSYGGNAITLECFDALAELRDFNTRGLNTKTYNWDNYDLASQRRNTVIERLITDSVGDGNAYLDQNSSISNLNNGDTGSGSGTRFRYEISAVQMASDVGKIQPKRTSGSSVLNVMNMLASEDPHTSGTADKSHGYTYYVDPNMVIAKPIAGTWNADTAVEINPPQMLNYFKRGTRPTNDPSTNGLTVRFGTDQTTITSGTDYKIDQTANQSHAPNTVATIYNADGSVDTANDSTLYRKGTKVMLASYSFNKPSQELYTDVLLTYSTKGEKGKQEVQLSQRVELLNVSALSAIIVSGSPFYIGQDLFDHLEHPNAEKNPPGKLQWSKASNSNTWTDVNAYVHFASATSSSSVAVNGSDPVTDYEQVVIGVKNNEIEDFETQMRAMKSESNAAYIPLRVLLWNGSTAYNTTSSTTFTFNSTISTLGKGRAKEAFGGLRRPRNISVPDLTSIESIRTRLHTSLARTNMEVRRGTFTISGAPFYSVDLKVKTATSDVFTFESIGASTSAIDLTTLGVKVGFTIQNFGTDSTFGFEVRDNNAGSPAEDYYNNGPSFGYIKTMASDTQISCGTSNEDGLSYGWTHTVPSVGHYVRIHVPLRTGDYLRVECPQDQIAGNHILTNVDFLERGGNVQTTIDTVGRNEDIALTTSLGIPSSSINTQIENARKSGEWGWDANSLPMGQRKFRLHGFTFTRTDYRTLTWSAGKLEVDGEYYDIATGTTYNTNNSTHLANDAQSYIYFNKDISKTVLITRNEATQYVPDGDDLLLVTARANTDTTKGSIYWLYGEDPSKIQSLDIYKDDPAAFIDNEKLTSALLGKGAQQWSTNIKFEGTDFDDIKWGISTNTNNNGLVSFGDDDTEAVTAGTELGLSVGPHWVYKRVGADANASLVVTPTYSDVTRANTDRILMATIVVAADVNQESPTIFPVSGNTPTLSVGAFAARSILATDIKTGTLTADEIASNAITAGAILTGALDSHVITLTGDGRFVTTAGLDRVGSNQWTTNSVSSSTGGLLIDNIGILGTSASGGGDADETEFYLSAADGKAYFGGGKVVASKGGIVIGEGGGTNGFLTWEAPSLDDVYIYRQQVTGGIGKGALICNAIQGIAFDGHIWGNATHTSILGGSPAVAAALNYRWFEGLQVEQIHFQSTSPAYKEFATLQAPTNYSSGDSTTARYTITLPIAGPTDDGQSLQTSGGGTYHQLVWASAGGGGGVTQITAGSNVSINQSTGNVTITATDTDTNTWRGIDDTPVNSQTAESISSNWAYDHAASTHGSGTLTGNASFNSNKGVFTSGATELNDTTYEMTSSAVGSNASRPTVYAGLLYSNGTTTLSGLSTGAGDADVRVGTGVYTDGIIYENTSSQRYKENIVTLAVDSSKIYDLTPKTFKWKDYTITDNELTERTITGETDFGLIAEDVHTVLPELVGYKIIDDSNEPNAVNYKMLSVLLLEEMKKLNARITALEA